MLDAPRTPARALATRRVREVDVYGGPGEASERPQPNIFAVIWRRRWIVLGCVLLALAVGITYFAKATPIYGSSSIVYVQDAALKMVSDPMGGGGRSQGFLFTQCQLITSTAILSDALKKPDMASVKSLQGAQNPVGVLKSSITAVPDKMGDLINVSMESTSAQDAATMVNAVVEAYIDYQGRQHKSTAVEVLKIFQKEVDQHETNLHKTQMAMLNMKKENPDLTFQTERGSIVTNQLSELSDRLTQAQLRSLDIKTAAAEADAVKDDPAALRRLVEQFQITSDESIAIDPAMMASYRTGRERLSEMLDRLGSKHEMVRMAEKQMGRIQEELQQAARETAASYSSMLKQSLRIADARVEKLQGAMDALRQSAVALNFRQAELEQLRKDEERITRSLELLDSRIKEINVNEDVGSLTVSVLETAKPGSLVRPLQTKVLGMALVAGLMSGVGLAMLRDLMDQRLRSADEITAVLDLPILGVVPHMMGKNRAPERGRTVHTQPRSNIAEAYRTIRTAVSFGAGDGVTPKTLLVTSPAPGDGKSTCCSNLAVAFAQSGRRTLLIDADCRRPTQDRIHEIEPGHGISDVLAGQVDLADAVRKTEIENLFILPCGVVPPNPSELLDSQALIDLLQRVSQEYDQVLIDSPPVVPVTDARILAASCDAAIIVLRAERSTRRLAEHASDALASVGANLIGVIVNDVPRGKNGQGYDYYYGYGQYGYKSATNGRLSSANGDHAANGTANGTMVVPSRTIDG
ncbi:MAG TPA: polysaccharide biosynthesis tyrosine autokinase [Tepidisphaeraceae bacterium]|jgi:capsular exopolysaccharide synthesis family protein